MSTAAISVHTIVNIPIPKAEAPPNIPAPGEVRWHRLEQVRRQQGVSLRRVARALKVDMSEARRQEQSSTDLRLSDLYAWQKVLDVPLADLLTESGESLSAPVLERARLLKLMKTAAAIHEKSECNSLRRMAEMLISQLLEIMPELEGVSPWHVVGQRRTLEDYGRVVERRLSDGVWRDL
jgi:transcriptional regulator with XRE-family HTH domain